MAIDATEDTKDMNTRKKSSWRDMIAVHLRLRDSLETLYLYYTVHGNLTAAQAAQSFWDKHYAFRVCVEMRSVPFI